MPLILTKACVLFNTKAGITPAFIMVCLCILPVRYRHRRRHQCHILH